MIGLELYGIGLPAEESLLQERVGDHAASAANGVAALIPAELRRPRELKAALKVSNRSNEQELKDPNGGLENLN